MKFVINNARLAFPSLFEAKQVGGQGDPRFSAAFLLPPDHPQLKLIEAAITKVAAEKWKDRAAEVLKSLKANGKLCFRHGDAKAEYAGYAGNYFINTSNKVRPLVLDRNKSPLTAADGKPYGGCYVNASIEFWAQDNQHGKRINATLLAVQFYADGDAFSGGATADANDFEDLGAPTGDGDVWGGDAGGLL